MAEQALKHSRGSMVALGILQIVTGMLAIAVPFAAGVAVVWVLGAILCVVGVVHVFKAFQAKTFWSGAGDVIGGLLYLFLGVVVFFRPMLGLSVLTLLVAIFFFVRGFVQIGAAFQFKPAKGWGWILFGGILAVLLGILLLFHWPLSGLYAIGVLVGVEMIFTGMTLLMCSGGCPVAGEGDAEDPA